MQEVSHALEIERERVDTGNASGCKFSLFHAKY